MVGFSPEKPELPNSAYALGGALSGVFTRASGQPLDVLKIRFQVHVTPIGKHTSSKYHGLYHACKSIYQQEGVKAFFKGHVPAQMLSIIYGVVQFGSFELLTSQAWKHLPATFTTDYRPVTHFVCGGLSGSIATLACQPFDVLRTRFVTQGEPKIYKSLFNAFESMLKQEGPRAFYKGLVPTLLQVAPQTALQFGIYTQLSLIWKKFAPRQNEVYIIGEWESLICGSGSGFLSKLIIYPLDMIKKRLQVQGFEKGWSNIGQTRKYNGLFDCFKSVLREEGPKGLYKGLSPSLLKAVLVTAISFWCYEQTINIITFIYHRKVDET